MTTTQGSAGSDTAPEPHPPQHVAIVTGLSGGGKTATAKLFEDLTYTVVDNASSMTTGS